MKCLMTYSFSKHAVVHVPFGQPRAPIDEFKIDNPLQFPSCLPLMFEQLHYHWVVGDMYYDNVTVIISNKSNNSETVFS